MSISATSLRVRSDLRAGAIVCYDNSSGYLIPVVTPCSTGNVIYPPVYPDPVPVVPTTPGVQWLSCQQCTGTQIGAGQLAPAKCEVCYT
jgi:hypothetical protein